MKHKRFKARKTYARLDHFLTESLTEMSRSQVAHIIKGNHVKLNDKPIYKKNIEIHEGDVVDVELVELDREQKEYRPSLELIKLFEDDYLLIIDKPCGVSVHPGSGEHRETILDVFRFLYPRINEIEDAERPGIVHRLDKDTSGVLILAKDTNTMKRLQKQFKRREIKKTYLALVSGGMRYRNGVIDAPIGRSLRDRTRFKVVDNEQGREAITEFSVIRYYPDRDFSFVKLFPHTGRTHQLRVHLSYYGNPILGDRVYGKHHTFKRLALHAYSLEFRHPITANIIQSYSVLPEIFRRYLGKKDRNC
ncbi:MAG: RluA family pseudouridine synthase [Candidatus Aminicenantes bacterium]|nr:RluA family pseudouridine synthase [Candidatus Aminicenantes bacterium]NIM82132.1 RluA family pseudouridine synthase [Candidatus Aminicenantes bacterium]NIN21529.1 RluA family pseudouridine synthase [Candidatus Aminicenantes bacterium]NIN45338.1 RluA family pseudouridine synthase [Candidatus Aminicenantes bacterium]NIN88159.1 RluA family pseudouridine synthase [Candidatus Aminicenantes bacterium]